MKEARIRDRPIVKIICIKNIGITQRAVREILVLKKIKNIINTIHEKRKSTNFAIMVEYTRISLGK